MNYFIIAALQLNHQLVRLSHSKLGPMINTLLSVETLMCGAVVPGAGAIALDAGDHPRRGPEGRVVGVVARPEGPSRRADRGGRSTSGRWSTFQR